MRQYQPSMEAMMYASRAPKRDKEGNVDPAEVHSRNTLRNVLLAQGVGYGVNSVLDALEPKTAKREEEKDFGDRLRETARTVANVAIPAYTAYQMFRPGTGTEAVAQGLQNMAQPEPNVNTEKQDLGGPQAPGPGDNAYTSNAIQTELNMGDASAVERFVGQRTVEGGSALLKGTLIDRQRQAEADTKLARSERMPGVMRDLNKEVDADMAQRLAGLEKEAAQYPKLSQPQESDYKKMGEDAAAQFLANQAGKVAQETSIQDFAEVAPKYVASTQSSNPLLKREPASSFAEEFGDPGGRRESSAEFEKRQAKSLGDFYASIPADPQTGERNVNFAASYNEDRGAVEPKAVVVQETPRNSGQLLQGQLQGQTSYDQQESREPFVRAQSIEAAHSIDEQGPDVPQVKAMAQKDDYLVEVLGQLGRAQADTQRQLREMNVRTTVPTADTNPDYVKSDFLVPERKAAPEPSKTVPSVGERLKAAGIGMQGMPVEFDGDGIGINVQGRGDSGYKSFESLSDIGAKAALERAGVSAEEATDYWTGQLKSQGLIEDAQPQRKVTIIEETAPRQESTRPMDVAERLRRIQTSGRPNARQEAQDFLSSIKSQMTNG